MRFSVDRFRQPERWQTAAGGLLAVLIGFAVLWRGGKGLEATWLLTAIAFVCTVEQWGGRHKREQVPLWLWGTLMVFVLWTGWSYLLSSTANYGLDEVLRTGSLALIALWAARHRALAGAHSRTLNTAMHVLVASLLIAILIGMAVYMMQPVNRFVGTFFDHRFHTDYWPNAWAQFLLLSWPLLAWFKGRSLLERPWLLSALLGTLLGSLALSYSRGALIAFGGQIGLWILVSLLQKQFLKDKRKAAIRLSILLAATAVTFVSVNAVRSNLYEVQSVGEKVTFSADEGRSSVDERRQFWSQAWQLSREKPLFGWGPYSFRFIQPRLQEGVLATSDHAHNLFLKIGMERGWPAAMALALFLMSVLATAFLRIVRGKYEPLEFAALLSVAGVTAHNFIDYNLQFVGIALPYWLLLGLLMSPLIAKREKRETVFRGVLEVLISFILLIVAVREGMYLITSSVGRHAEAAGDTQTALTWYDYSAAQWFSRDLHLSRAVLRLEGGEDQAALAALDQYQKQNTEDPRAWKLRGDICRSELKWDCALEGYQKAYLWNRWNDAAAVRAYVETLLSSGKREQLDQLKPELDRLLNEYQFAVRTNAHFIALSSNVDHLIALANLLAQAYPGDQEQYVVLGEIVENQAAIERERYHARPPGYLW